MSPIKVSAFCAKKSLKLFLISFTTMSVSALSMELHLIQPSHSQYSANANSACRGALIKRLDKIASNKDSQCSLKIAMYSFNDRGLFNKLKDIKKAGHLVQIILDEGQNAQQEKRYQESIDQGKNIGNYVLKKDFEALGIPVTMLGAPYGNNSYGSSMHHKFTLFSCDIPNQYPEKEVMMGSYNWTAAANTRNFEDCLFIKDNNIFDQFDHHFDSLVPSVVTLPNVSSSVNTALSPHVNNSGIPSKPLLAPRDNSNDSLPSPSFGFSPQKNYAGPPSSSFTPTPKPFVYKQPSSINTLNGSDRSPKPPLNNSSVLAPSPKPNRGFVYPPSNYNSVMPDNQSSLGLPSSTSMGLVRKESPAVPPAYKKMKTTHLPSPSATLPQTTVNNATPLIRGGGSSNSSREVIDLTMDSDEENS